MQEAEESPARGLKALLAKNRRGREEPVIPEETVLETGPRESSDTVLEKIRSKLDTLEQKEAESDGKLSKLLPGHTKRKEKRRRKAQEAEGEEQRGRGYERHDSNSASGGDESRSGTAEDASSFLTSDSEREETSRPRLVDHESHAGYLTASSPQIRAATFEATAGDNRSTFTSASSPLVHPTKLRSNGSLAAKDKLATHNELSSSQTSAGASSLSIDSEESGKSGKSRGVSPGSKIKDAFKPSRRNAAPSNTTSERGVSPLGGLFIKDKSDGSPTKSPTRTNTLSQDSPHTKTKNPTQSLKSVPSIVTTPVTPPALPHRSLPRVETTVTPPTPVDRKKINIPETRHSPSNSLSSSPNVNGSPTNNSPILHRRARSETSNQPTKLSHSVAPPLTPTVEEIKTQGTRNISQSSGGFFTSMISAAQNAANTISNIGNNNSSRPRSTTAYSGTSSEEKAKSIPEETDESEEVPVESNKPLAIDTIGSGELSLSHLGISPEPSSAVSNSPSLSGDGKAIRSRSSTVVQREEASARAENVSAARAVSAAYSHDTENSVTPMVEDVVPNSQPPLKPGSTYEGSILNEKTPPTSVYEGDNSGIFRSGSLRNKVERAKKRRHRNNSSGGTIGAAISATNSAFIGGPSSNTAKVTGFAVATKKRNRDFHQLFRSVPEDDYLIEDYNCALQRDILLAGRIYISEGHICFSSNILGWITTLVISFDEIVCIEKESTAMVFPNAIAIQTLHARHTFRSLINRDSTYDLMIKIWKISHPGLQLRSSENGVNVTNGTGSKTEKVDGPGSDLGSPGSDDGEYYDEDDESDSGEDDASEVGTTAGSIQESAPPDSPPKLQRKPSNIGSVAGQANSQGPTVSEVKAAERASGVAVAAADFPGPATHAPTECADSSTHYEKILKDEVIPAPLGKIYSMVFGSSSGGFMSRWLVDDQKCTDLQMDDAAKPLGEDCKTRSYSYIKPLGGSIGPKQTKCIISEQLDAFDLEKAVTVTITTQTPDVPSGNVFSVKTRYCLMWGPNNGTRMIMCCQIEWTGKSWLKGPIEKGANDGQIQYANDLFKALRSGVSSKPKAGATSKGRKGGKKKRSGDTAKSSTDALPAQVAKASWGLLEPVRFILEPISDTLWPVVNVYTLSVVVTVLAVLFWRSSRSGPSGVGGGPQAMMYAPVSGLTSAQRKVAYEELWRSEEAALWAWLEERVGGVDGIVVPGTGKSGDILHGGASAKAKRARQQVLNAGGKGLSDRDVRRAIEVTEEKLKVLKEAVGVDSVVGDEL